MGTHCVYCILDTSGKAVVEAICQYCNIEGASLMSAVYPQIWKVEKQGNIAGLGQNVEKHMPGNPAHGAGPRAQALARA